MNRGLEQSTVDGIAQRLADLLAVPANLFRVNLAPGGQKDSSNRPDLLLWADIRTTSARD